MKHIKHLNKIVKEIIENNETSLVDLVVDIFEYNKTHLHFYSVINDICFDYCSKNHKREYLNDDLYIIYSVGKAVLKKFKYKYTAIIQY